MFATLQNQIVNESTAVNERITSESNQTRCEISELRGEVSGLRDEVNVAKNGHHERFMKMQEALGYIRQDNGRIQGYLDIPPSPHIVVKIYATGLPIGQNVSHPG